MTVGPGARLDIGVLGPLRVAAGEPIAITRPSHRRLLAILLHAGGARVSRDVLIDRLWAGDPPPSARAALQMHVAALRRLLPPDLIVTEVNGYSLNIDHHDVDVRLFDDLAATVEAAARRRSWADAATAGQAALALWRGAPFDELIDDDFAMPERVRLTELHHLVLERRAEALIESGDPSGAVADLEGGVAAEPLRERRWELLARARHLLGRQTEALRAVQAARGTLADVGLEPGSSLLLVEQEILAAPASVARPGRRAPLPTPLTAFIGRTGHLERTRRAIEQHRLVTLTGTGGAGKTRLAIEVGRLRSAADAACVMVELAGARPGIDLVALLATGLGLDPGRDPAAVLRDQVGDADVLVVVDNCEHVVADTAAGVAAALRAAPGLRVLATSRLPLGVPGELVVEIGPLPVPDDDEAPDRVERSEAVQLFVDRARLVHPRLSLDAGGLDHVAEVCRRLDGLPLAIELAAAQVRTLGLSTIAGRLHARLALVEGGSPAVVQRHRGLRAAIEWSHDLLAPVERRLLARLAVFRGTFDLEAVVEVCEWPPVADAAGAVGALVDHSLLVADDSAGGRRYRLLETIREFAHEQLTTDELPLLRTRHLACCARRCDALRERWHSRPVSEVRAAIADDLDDLDAALEHARAVQDRSRAASVAACLGWLTAHRGQAAASVALLREAASFAGSPSAEADLRSMLATELFAAEDPTGADREAAHVLELLERASPSAAVPIARLRVANLHLLLIDHDSAAALPLAGQAVAEAEAIGDVAVRFRALSFQALALSWNGLVDASSEAARRARACAVTSGDVGLVAKALVDSLVATYLGGIDRRTGAAAILDELEALRGDDDTLVAGGDWMVFALMQLGRIAHAERVLDRRERLHLEGYDRVGQLVMRATAHWMQHRLDAAADVIDELERHGVSPRWFHDFYPMAASVAAERGRLDEVRRLADDYLAVPVDPSEEVHKLAVSWPLTAATVDAARGARDAGDDRAGDDLANAAREVVRRARRILAEHPPRSRGSVQLEVPATYLALAEAELARLDGPAVEAWQHASQLPDYAAIRAYAERRLAEARAADVSDGAAR